MPGKIQSQYEGTNIQTLLTGLDKVFKKYTAKPLADFLNNIYDLDTAAGIGLDLWGAVLNFPRVIKGLEPDEFFTLTDDQYRIILKLLALQTKAGLTIPEINARLAQLFAGFGSASYAIDKQDMTYVNYVFVWEIPDWLRAAFANYKLLPSPMGVGATFEAALHNYIGFEGQNLTNFYRAIFNINPRLDYLPIGFEGQDLGNFENSIFINNGENTAPRRKSGSGLICPRSLSVHQSGTRK